MDAPVIRVASSASEAARLAALEFVANARRGSRFRVALAGGSTPRAMYRLLATELRDEVDWPRVEAFFGDERCVPADDERSNYRMAREALLDDVPIGAVHRVEAERGAVEAADRYDALLKSLGDPLFDLVLLGMGADGHTLSLFPGLDVRSMEGRLAAAVEAPAGVSVRPRVTLTPAAVARSRVALFLVTGADKAPALRRIREGASPPPPAAMVRGRERTEWIVDRDAAGGG